MYLQASSGFCSWCIHSHHRSQYNRLSPSGFLWLFARLFWILPPSYYSLGFFLRRRRKNFGILSHSKGNFNENLWNCKQQSKQQQQSQCMPSLNPPTPSHPWGGDSPSGPTLHRLTVPIPLLTGKAKKIEITYFSCDCEDANPLGKIIQAQNGDLPC